MRCQNGIRGVSYFYTSHIAERKTAKKREENMKVTKSKGTTVVEITKDELQRYNLTFGKLDCSKLHTVSAIKSLFKEATGQDCSFEKEVILLPDCSDGCVIVCKEREGHSPSGISFSSCTVKNESEIFCSFFS